MAAPQTLKDKETSQDATQVMVLCPQDSVKKCAKGDATVKSGWHVSEKDPRQGRLDTLDCGVVSSLLPPGG